MRKVICLLAAMILCTVMVSPAFATQSAFVPSITYKPTPGVTDAVMIDPDEGEVGLRGCIIVTSITQAEEKTTDIAQEDRDLLLEVYEKLSDGSMVLPFEDKNYVVFQLVDVSFAKTACVDAKHLHKEWLEREKVTAELDFDLDVSEDAVVQVLRFYDGQWAPVESVVNNGDGTLTCVFEEFCPAAFCLETEEVEAPQETNNSLLWVIVLLLCAAAIVILVIYREKKKKKKED